MRKLEDERNPVLKEIKKMHKHLDQRQHALIFRRCLPGAKMCRDCRKRKTRLPKEFSSSLPKKEDGGLFYVPRADESNPGKNITYMEQVEETKKQVKILPDSDLDNMVTRCQVRCNFNAVFLI